MQLLMFPLRNDNPPSTSLVAVLAIIALFLPSGDLNDSPKQNG